MRLVRTRVLEARQTRAAASPGKEASAEKRAGGGKALVIVESPTKAKTISKFLPKGRYVVQACYGHIRDLPKTAKDVPAEAKGTAWGTLGVNVEADFEPLYIVPAEKKKVLGELRRELKEADELILATDEDREGEAISWHLCDVLRPAVPVKRMVFHEITERAIKEALGAFRDIDMNLVHAQEARRIIDRLAGYTVSPVLWRKIAPGLSAGRVQSVALKLLVDREAQRLAFRSAEPFPAVLTHLDGRRLVSGKDFSSEGKLEKAAAQAGAVLLDEAGARALAAELAAAGNEWRVQEVAQRDGRRGPAAPFVTSTLQQEANRKLGLSAKETMRTAQELYESGLITYMRTDSPSLSPEALEAARASARALYGPACLPRAARTYAARKAKGAQEAHEAIRPAVGPAGTFASPRETGLQGRPLALYELVWMRTVASQMIDARFKFTTVTVAAGPAGRAPARATFRASGKVIEEAGFLRAYAEGREEEGEEADGESLLPPLAPGDRLAPSELAPKVHRTQPPPRFSEARLVEELEKQGVGRPSTYASIIDTVLERGYAVREAGGRALAPTLVAFAVSGLLSRHFGDLVDPAFTSEMESHLDEIAAGQRPHAAYLHDYFLGERGLKRMVEEAEPGIDTLTARRLDLLLPALRDSGFQVLVNKYGPYLQTDVGGKRVVASLPAVLSPAELTPEIVQRALENAAQGPQPIGTDPASRLPVYILVGQYGPYVQLGTADDAEKPRRASVPRGMSVEAVDLPTALRLLSLPRSLGAHPGTGKEVVANTGPFGPYLSHDGLSCPLPAGDSPYEVGMERALELLAALQKRIALEFPHPDDAAPVRVMTSRLGVTLRHNKTVVKLPRGTDVASIGREEALAAIAQAEGAKPSGSRRGKAAQAAPEAATATPAARGRTKAAGSAAAAPRKARSTTTRKAAAAAGDGEAAPKAPRAARSASEPAAAAGARRRRSTTAADAEPTRELPPSPARGRFL
eukprot:tig00000823_g4544.t1